MNCLSHTFRFHAIGETKHLFNNGIDQNITLCSCGDIIDNCKFWSQIPIKKIQKNLVYNHKFFYKYIRNSKAPIFLYDWYLTKKIRRSQHSTIQDIQYFYSSFKDINTIDSSKSIHYSKILDYVNQSPSIKVHVVRNVLGVYHSMRKKVKKPEIVNNEEFMYSSENFFLLSLKWSLTNLYIYLSHLFSKNYFLIRYEDFVKDPNRSIDFISKKIKTSNNYIDNTFSLDSKLNHSISGNPSRMNKSTTIKFDDEWIKSIPFGKRLLIFIINLPVMLLFGYSWKK
tara:strand:- start:312 stop:1160 length:849 start_codon:yes stop_codon:yes gene_type:complete